MIHTQSGTAVGGRSRSQLNWGQTPLQRLSTAAPLANNVTRWPRLARGVRVRLLVLVSP